LTHILVYGTLRRGCGLHRALCNAKYLRDVRVPGFDMINLGGCPGIVPNPNNKEGIFGEVYEVDDDTLQHLDHIEGYNPKYPDRSAYCRQYVQEDAQAYVWTRPRNEWNISIPSGNWENR
jgi:gamma-glutamylcyclotransferase (GGCT)/AIG2-like uncharacterized protein YtfP